MTKKVCMFVWNHFTNDARVLRECSALSENGYDVDLICIQDPSQKELPMYEARSNNFRVYRVRRYPLLLEILQSTLRFLKRNKPLALLTVLGAIASMYYLPFFTSIAAVLLFLTWKLRAVWAKANVITRMVTRGFTKKYDIYHSNDLNTLPQGYICSKLRVKKKKFIYDSHEVQTSRTGYNSSIYGKLESFFIKRIDTMIVENHTRAKFNEELYGNYPNVVHNYPFKQKEQYDKAPIRDMLGLPDKEKILLYQGGIQVGRGLDKLIQAAPLFNEGTLVLIGDGKIKRELQEMVSEMGLNHKVKFLPKVPLKELPQYTRNAFIGFQVLNNICFNHYSASSNKLFEYLSAGAPVVACSFPEIKKVVEGEQVGICTDSHDPKAIAEAVNKLLIDKDLYDKYKNNCYVAREKYNWDVEKENFLKVYKENAGE